MYNNELSSVIFPNAGQWTLSYEIVVQSFIKQETIFQYKVFDEDLHETRTEKHDILEGLQTVKLSPITLAEDAIKKWWPNGYGSQKLYTATVSSLFVVFYTKLAIA